MDRDKILLDSIHGHGSHGVVPLQGSGKLTQMETFRVGCIGAISPKEMAQAVHAVAGALQDMGIPSAAPAH